jgi:hypothetical protein
MIIKNIPLVLLLILSSPVLGSTYVYKGHIANKEITLYSDSNFINAFWVDKDDHKQIQHPLSSDCKFINSCDNVSKQTDLTLYDDTDIYIDNNTNQIKFKDSISYFKFNHIWAEQNKAPKIFGQNLMGYWFDGKKNQQYTVTLQKQFEISNKKEDEFNHLELLQSDSSDKAYFTAVLSKKKQEKIRLVGINVYAKNNHQLLQKIRNLNYSYNYFNSIELKDINFDGQLDLAIKKYPSQSRLGDNEDYYINVNGKFVATNLWGSNIYFNSKDSTATGQKDCYDYNEKQQKILTTIQSIYHYKKHQYIHIKNSCLLKNIDTNQDRQCNDNEYNNCLLKRNNIHFDNPHYIDEDNILYKNMVWYKGKIIDGYVYDDD